LKFGAGEGWRRLEKISWSDRARNEEVLHRVKEQRNILRAMKRKKAGWIGRNCLINTLSKER
jgi:hypothetical protein